MTEPTDCRFQLARRITEQSPYPAGWAGPAVLALCSETAGSCREAHGTGGMARDQMDSQELAAQHSLARAKLAGGGRGRVPLCGRKY